MLQGELSQCNYEETVSKTGDSRLDNWQWQTLSFAVVRRSPVQLSIERTERASFSETVPAWIVLFSYRDTQA